MKVTILGAGAFGLALGQLWHQNSQHQITIWTAFLEEKNQLDTYHKTAVLPNISIDKTLAITTNLKEALKECDILVVAIPVQHIRKTLEQVATIENTLPTIIVSKGIEQTTMALPSDIYKKVGMKGDIAILAGPTFAKDVILNVPLGFTVATNSQSFIAKIKDLFYNTNSNLEQTTDILGVEYCSSLKNVMAIMMGTLRQEITNDSTYYYCFTKIYQSICELIIRLGGQKETTLLQAGLGDTLLTCNSFNSRNYQYGKLLILDRKQAKTFAENTTVEGKQTLKALQDLLKHRNIQNDILQQWITFVEDDKQSSFFKLLIKQLNTHNVV